MSFKNVSDDSNRCEGSSANLSLPLSRTIRSKDAAALSKDVSSTSAVNCTSFIQTRVLEDKNSKNDWRSSLINLACTLGIKLILSTTSTESCEPGSKLLILSTSSPNSSMR